jgi:uncharacterized membrane protein
VRWPAPGFHRRLLVVVGVVLVATLVGLAVLWPPSGSPVESLAPPEPAVAAAIVDVTEDPAGAEVAGVVTVTVELLEGPWEGELRTLPAVSTEVFPQLRVGDRLDLERVVIDGEPQYYIRDFQRLPTLAGLVALFALAVLSIGRWHGVRSLLGLALSLLLVVRFVVPAILAGSSPPLVAMVGAMAIMIVTLYLTHGVNEMTTSAVVGTAGALLLTIGLASLFIDRGRITGYASEEAVFARFAVEGLDLQGLVLAGLIIAALGVLDDITISQASTVFALHDTDPRLSWSALFARAMKVGRDHIASVVNTLFLAYAGASLALLVLFSTGGLPVAQILNSEVLAQEIVKTVVGSLGLIAAVPLTTALAATVARQRPATAVGTGSAHVHVHGTDRALGEGARAAGGDAGRAARRPSDAAVGRAMLAAVDARIHAADDPVERARWQRLRASANALDPAEVGRVLAAATGDEPDR